MEFAEWYVRFRPVLAAALIVLSGETDIATDAADEALVRAFERWERVRTLSSPGGWAYQVGVNVLRRKMRRRGLERRLLMRVIPASPPPELRPDVWMAVKALPPRQREVIALRYIVGMSEAEVAATMGIAVGTASATLSAARSRLAVSLAEDEHMEVDT